MDNIPKRRRRRGVILTEVGLARFQAAKTDSEYTQQNGRRYTLEALSEKTGVSMETLAKVLACDVRVDKQTLKCCFRAFGLSLEQTDYYLPDLISKANPDSDPTALVRNGSISGSSSEPGQPYNVDSKRGLERMTSLGPIPPGGQLALDSPFYISRIEAENSSYEAIAQPGALVRIQGARQTGKTSLMSRLARHAQQRQYHAIPVSFQLAEKSVLQDLDQLLRWFCASVGLGVSLSPNLETYWDSLFGCKISCKLYFEQYLLPPLQQPAIILLDDVECLFNYPEVADEFFGFLRTCYEEAKTSLLWQKVRVVIAQASEVYIPLTIHKSPFNVGVAIPLRPFTPDQIQALGARYNVTIELKDAIALCDLVAGHPYLSHLVIYHVWHGDTTLYDVLEQTAQSSIFLPYLQQQERRIQQDPTLRSALNLLLSNTVNSSDSALSAPASEFVSLLPDIYRLQSLGLATLGQNGPQLSCNLLKTYFTTSP